MQTLRVPIFWANVQPRRTTLHWGATDKVVGDLAVRGIRPVPFVYGSPAWVAQSPAAAAWKHKEGERWRRFLTRLVERYGPGGAYWEGKYEPDHPGARAVPITAWQIWNEPNLRAFFLPRRGNCAKVREAGEDLA